MEKRVFKITESQYRNYLKEADGDNNANNDVVVSLKNPSEQDKNPTNISTTLEKTRKYARNSGINTNNISTEVEVEVNGKTEELTSKPQNESRVFTINQLKRSVNENKKNRIIKISDLIRKN